MSARLFTVTACVLLLALDGCWCSNREAEISRLDRLLPKKQRFKGQERGVQARDGVGPGMFVHSNKDAHAKGLSLTVVMLNWLRPDNVQHIIRAYVSYGCIAEIIIWMCNPSTRFEMSHPKVRIIDDVSANEKFGLSTRFKACLLAKTAWVFIQDDDHYMREQGLHRMMAAKLKSPARLITGFGRDWPHGSSPQYIKQAVEPGPCRIALTALLLTDRDMCEAFWRHAPAVEPYVREHSRPFWNGEDIFFSLVSFKETGTVPLVVKAAKVFMSQKHTGIHYVGGHEDYRDLFLKHAVAALQLSYPDHEASSGLALAGNHTSERRARSAVDLGHDWGSGGSDGSDGTLMRLQRLRRNWRDASMGM